MDLILDFYDPLIGFSRWAVNTGITFILSYFAVWIIALILCRIGLRSFEDEQIIVYFSWLIPFAAHMISAGAMVIIVSFYYKQDEVSLLYCIPFILMAIVSGRYSLSLVGKLNSRINKLKERIIK